MIVDKKGMQAALADDFNQINLNNINLNITTTTLTNTDTKVDTTTATATTTATTIAEHAQNNSSKQSKSVAKSILTKRHHSGFGNALIDNPQHLLHTQPNQQHQHQQQQQQQQQQHTPHIQTMDELSEIKPLLRKSLSTPTFNALEPQYPTKRDVAIITNPNQQRQQPQPQQQQQQHQQQHLHNGHCHEHRNNLSNSCVKKSSILNTNCNLLPSISTTSTSNSSSSLDTSSLSQRFGCAHYKRKAMFVTPCCNKFYKCRFCHDEYESHHFDRKTLTELICSECNTRQKVQESCENCRIRFGKYTCLICNLFDDADKRQYHCDQCGICRIGGKENFFHCKVCNMCLPIQLKIDGHRCVENISRSHCPVCLGDIHTSRIPCQIPDCGHLLHKMCFDQLLTSGHYTCPTCQTSIIDMSALWEYLDVHAKLMALPKKYENQKIHIFCNDCHKTSKTNFHFIGLKCLNCGAYNTTPDVKRRMSHATGK